MASESVAIANIPDSGSPQRVALDLAERIKIFSPGGDFATKDDYLDLYAECLVAAKGLRSPS